MALIGALRLTPVGGPEMDIHDDNTAAFTRVGRSITCRGTSITEENMAEAHTTHTVLSVTGCIRFLKFIFNL